MANRGITQSIFDVKKAVAALRSVNLFEDIQEAQKDTLNYYVKRLMKNRFRGKKFNPDYPPLNYKYLQSKRKKYGLKPTLVATGRLKRTTLQSKGVKSGKRVYLRLRTTYYSGYVRRRRDFVPPKLKSEEVALSKYFKRRLGRIRRKRQRGQP